MKMKDVIISITGTQNFDDTDDCVELVTDGQYCFNDGEQSTLTYMESELTGLEGTRTSFVIDPMSITMLREGKMNSRMIFEEGKKHFFLYETPFGAATMGVDTHRIKTKLGEHGGDMEIDYVVDFDHAVVGRNKFVINVREMEKGGAKWQI